LEFDEDDAEDSFFRYSSVMCLGFKSLGFISNGFPALLWRDVPGTQYSEQHHFTIPIFIPNIQQVSVAHSNKDKTVFWCYRSRV